MCVSTRVSGFGSAAPDAPLHSGGRRREGDDRLPPGRPVGRHLHLLKASVPASRGEPQGPPAVRQLDQRSTASSSTRPNPSRPRPTSATGSPVTSDAPAAQRSYLVPGPSNPTPMLPTTLPMPALAVAEVVRSARPHHPGVLVFSSSAGDLLITIPGQLAIKTIHGRNGDFSVGRLATSIGEFVLKNRTRPIFREGKVRRRFRHRRDSSLHVQRQRPHGHRDPRPSGRDDTVNIDALSRDEARQLVRRKSIDRRGGAGARAGNAPAKPKAKPRSPPDPLVDTTPFGSRSAPVSLRPRPRQMTRRCSALCAPGRDRETRCDRGSSCAASAARPSRQAGLRVRSVVPGWHLKAA